jgi:hypothetical protein
MAITIQAQLAKKLPIPGSQFSSQQASITISAEVNDINNVVSEAARLYALAEQAVDAQLAENSAPVKVPVVQQRVTSSIPSSSPSQQLAASRPYRTGGQRRSAITPAQLRFLQKLILDTHTSLPAILAHHEIGSLENLSAGAASSLIDELRARMVRA